MSDLENVIKGFEICIDRVPGEYSCNKCPYEIYGNDCEIRLSKDALALLKEQEKKRIILRKKHVITWSRNDEFSMRKLYEVICKTLLDEGELFIARTDDHEKVDFVFSVVVGEARRKC